MTVCQVVTLTASAAATGLPADQITIAWAGDTAIVDNFVDMYPNSANQYCCGGGGGAWAMPYEEERIYYGRVKAKQIKDTGAKLLIAPCHNCRDQIMKSLRKEYDMMDVEVKYLWELVADSLDLGEGD